MSSKLTLAEVKAEFEHWRVERKHSRQIIPQELWKLVKHIINRYKLSEITRELRINYQQLRDQVDCTKTKSNKPSKPTKKAAQTSSVTEQSITFAPVNIPMKIQQPALTVEIKQADGQTVVLHANSDTAIAAIVERIITPCMGGK